jgi:signal transduction histidine kinase
MNEATESSKFKSAWAAWVAELASVGVLANTLEERALVLRVKQVLEATDLVAQLCHDVKDPLASIVMGLSLLEKMHGSEPFMATIVAAARRLDRVVIGAHDLARLRRSDYQVHLQSIPIASLVTTIVENCRAKAPRGIHIYLVVQPDVPNVLGDAGAVSRIVQELMDNAIGFSHDGGAVDVNVSLEREQAVVVIADNGPGIDPAHLSHVFDEASNRTHRPRRGAGRGLPIAHALVALQGGALTIGQHAPTGCEATLSVRLASATSPQV